MIASSITLSDKLTQPALGRLAARVAATADLEPAVAGRAPTVLRLHAAIIGTTLAAFVALGMATASLLAGIVAETPAVKGDRLISDPIPCAVADMSNRTLCQAPEFRTSEERSAGMSVLTRMRVEEE